ncbi:MAG: imelysin family protein, partial [Hyphomicrobium sp.]
MPKVIPTVCLSLVVLICAAGQGIAHAAQPFAKLNERAIDEYVVPSFEKLELATAKLAATLGEACEGPPGQLTAVRDDYKQTVLAWAGVEFLRLGPMSEEARAERFDFSPDPRGVVERQLRKLLARRDAAMLNPDVLAKKSVAVQGLPALQVLLTSKKHSILADSEEGRYRCRLAVSIAKNLETIARQAVSGWTGPIGWREKMLKPGPENAPYKSSAEAAAALVRALMTGLKLIQDRQIMPMIATHSKPGKKPRLPFARSGLSADYIAASIASCKRYYEAMG